MKKKQRKRKREQVKFVRGTLPWESPHPGRGHIRNELKGGGLAQKYPHSPWGSDIMDFRLPGSFENGKRR